MSVQFIFWFCIIGGFFHAIQAMNKVRKYGRPTGSVDKNLFLYLMGNE